MLDGTLIVLTLQTTSRNYNFGRDPAVSRRGHAPQISISDDNHHVTEAIGDMYGDHQYGKRDSRPLSFIASNPPSPHSQNATAASFTSPSGSSPRSGSITNHRSLNRPNSIQQTPSDERTPTYVNGQPINMASRSSSGKSERGQISPSNSLKERSASDTANAHFPLSDIDYESSPNAVAQELNNLAALRRMSMDVNASGDPDLPSFPTNFNIPSAPQEDADPDDPSGLYWVPASVHPELAPMEFKTFLDKKVKSLRRRSEERGALSPEALSREGSGASLRRRKSMLSKQIDNTNGRGAEGYTDGAERLDRRRSQLGLEPMTAGHPNLQDLEVLVNEPERFIQRLSLEKGVDTGSGDASPTDDNPILPNPQANQLKRSTRTTYRRGGSLRKGERGPVARRAAKLGDAENEESLRRPPSQDNGSLTRVQTEPTPASEKVTENFSRPGRMNRRAGGLSGASQTTSFEEPANRPSSEAPEQPRERPQPRPFVSQIASNGRLGIPPEALHSKTVPSIVETPPEDSRHSNYVPERSSSHVPPPPPAPMPHAPSGPDSPSRMHKLSQSRTNQAVKPNQTLNEMTSHPSPLPGNNTRTDSLSFIPTLTEEKRGDPKKSKDKKGNDVDGGRKSSWSWGSLLGSEEKERRRLEDEKESKKSKVKIGKVTDKSYDSTRLDVLQTTMEGSRGRESLVLDRGDLRLEEERKKESSRKSNPDAKKEKDGFFSSLLGGGKRKAERESAGRKHLSRTLSPEPPVRVLRPDFDYNWTRFSILEERAIYRMAHIKLANPRRALHSQVLLSNFM